MRLSILVPTILSLPAVALADTIHVPGDYGTIQEAIDASSGGDTVLVAPGTYVENLDFAGKAITVRSDADGDPSTHDLSAATTIIDGNQAGTAVTFASGEGPASVLEGFTVTNGSGTDDGSTHRGGGVYCRGTSPTIARNVISGNSLNATLPGGGGGIACAEGASPTISYNTISGNSIASTLNTGGGGITCADGSSPTIVGNVISDNSATALSGYWVAGGGIMFHGSSGTVADNVIARNSSQWSGGIHCQGSSITVTNNRIHDNVATLPGGGIGAGWSQMVLANNTFFGNTSQTTGGAVYCEGNFSNPSVVTVSDTIFWGDGAPEGPEITIEEVTTLTIKHSDVDGGRSSVHVGFGAQLQWGAGMIDADPLFLDRANGDFGLDSGSPCIDAGDPAGAPGGRDGVGAPRFLDGDLDRVMVVDMGACEFDNVHLEVTGDLRPGGSMTFETTGTAGLSVLLFVGTTEGEVLLAPYGALFIDLSAPWLLMLEFADIGETVVLPIPDDFPAVSLVLQELAMDPDTGNGNLSNDVRLDIQ